MAFNNRMHHRVTIQTPTYTKDSSGGMVTTYVDTYTNISANVQPASGQAMFFYQQRNVRVSHMIKVDSTVTVSNGDIVVFGSRTFLITGFRDLNERGILYEIAVDEYIGEAPR